MADLLDIQERLKKAMMLVADRVMKEAVINIPSGVSPIMRENIMTSQYKRDKGDKFYVGFTHPDAEKLENGQEPIPFSGAYTQQVRRHTRKTKGGNVSVKRHKRKYKNHRPVVIDNKWFMMTQPATRQATKWLEKTVDRIFNNEIILAQEIKRELER